MKAEEQRRIHELAQLLKDLRMPHPPLERAKLATRLWQLVSNFPRSEQKSLLRHLGLANHTQLLGPLAMGRASVIPTPFLEYVEQAISLLTPGRISSLLEALSQQMAATELESSAGSADSPMAGSIAPLAPAQEENEADADVTPLPPRPPEEPEAEGASLEASGNSLADDRGSRDEPADGEAASHDDSAAEAAFPPQEGIALESNSMAPEEDRLPVPPLLPDVAKHDGEAELEVKLLRAAEPALVDRASPGSSVEQLVDRSNRLPENWRRRRFWLDVARRGFDRKDAENVLRAVAGAELAAQDYVWVVDEMAVRGLLPKRLISAALELAPSESAARLLERRLPALVDPS